MSKRNTIILTIAVLLFGFLLAGGTFAFWTWRSNNSNITFNTASNLKEYIEYDEGESQFAGSLQASSSYLTGSIHSTITINKKASAADVDLVASIMMDINAIGTNMKTSSALKWVVTAGTFSSPGQVLAQGNFIGTNAGDTLTLVPSLEVTTTPTNYTIWIWLDQNENPSELLSGETLDTNVWTQIDQVEGVAESFEVTRISANNQNISATAVNSKNVITNYAVTQSNTTPSSWQNIAQADQAKVYNLNTTVNATGTWYVWFKDSSGKTTSREVTVNTIDNTPPTCTFGSWSPALINNGQTATIDLTCTDAESQITQSKLEVSDLTKSNNAINITSINKTSITNGYKYTITVTGTLNDDTPTISLPANKIKNSQNLGNAIATSGSITVVNNYTITIKAGNGVSAVSGTGWTNTGTTQMTKSVQYGTVLNLCETTASATNIVATRKNGYTGCNATKTSGAGTVSNNTYTVTAGDATITLAATGIETPAPTINIDTTSKIYGLSTTNLSASVTNTYDSGITVNYTYYYDTNQNGSYANTQTNPISATSHQGTRYYKVIAQATDNTLTSTAATSSNNVSLTLIRTSYTPDANSCGTLSSSSALYAYKGESQLYNANTGGSTASWPTLTVNTGYTLNGWYTQSSNGSKVLNADGTIASTDVSGYTASSNFDSIENRTLYAQCSANSYNISYTLNGGTASNPTSAYYDTDVQIANPTKDGYIFLGWTSSTLGQNALSGSTSSNLASWNGSQTTNTYFKNLTESGTVTMIANWEEIVYLNIDTNINYQTLNDAFAAVANNQTIRVMKATVDESANTAPTLANTKTGVKLDLYGHTISLGTNTITNNGSLDIYSSVNGGVITGSNTSSSGGVVKNNGTLTTSNTASNTLTIQNTASSTTYSARVILNNQNKTVTLKTGTTLTFTNKLTENGNPRTTIENNGTLNVNGATIKSSNDFNNAQYEAAIINNTTGKVNVASGTINSSMAGIYNLGTAADAVTVSGGTITSAIGYGIVSEASGTMTITDGSITGYIVGVALTNGTLILGEKDSTVNTNSPVITGAINGVAKQGGTFNFYDGKIISNSGTGYSIYGLVDDTEVGYIVTKTTTNGVETAILTASNEYYNYLNVDTGKYYTTLNQAFITVANNQTIRVNNSSINEANNPAPTLANTKSGVKLDLYGHTISLGTNSLTNNGSLDIYSSVNGGVITGQITSMTDGVVLNNGTLTTSNTASNTLTIQNTAPSSSSDSIAIYNNANKTMTLKTGTTITSTNAQLTNYSRAVVANYGTLNINGATITNNPSASNIYNEGIANYGEVNMTSGTINTSGDSIFNGSTTNNSVIISGGSITSTNEHGIRNSSTGTITISQNASITSTNGNALYNESTGTIIVISGTVTGGIFGIFNESGTITLGDNSNAVNGNSPVITSTATSDNIYSIDNSSGTFNFYDGKVVSNRGTGYSIHGTVSDTPTGYVVVKSTTNGVETAELFHGYNISYNYDGGTGSNPTLAGYDAVIQLSNPTKEGYMFTGWTSTTLGANAKTGTTNNPTTSWDGTLTKNTYFKNLIDSGTVTLVANWTNANYQNVETGEGYATLNDAFAAVANNQTIRVVANTVNESSNTAPSLASTKTGVKLDLYGHTISLGTNTLTNNGGLDIYSSVNGGILTGANTSNTAGVILNNGTLTTSNTASNTLTIRNTAGSDQPNARVLVNNASKTATLKSGTTIIMTENSTSDERYVIENSGTLNINGASILTNDSNPASEYDYGINNNSTGKINMESGTINAYVVGIFNNGTAADSIVMSGGTINENCVYEDGAGCGGYAIYNNSGGTTITGGTLTSSSITIYIESGTLTLGTNDGTVNTNSPVIISTDTSGSFGTIETSGISGINFYDGKVIANNGTNYTISRGVSDTPVGYVVTKTVENNIETAILTQSNNYYNYLNIDTNHYYATLTDAFTAVQNNQTIRVNNATVDESSNTVPSLASTKSGVKLDLYGHTVSLGTNYIYNLGGLDIYSSVDGAVLEGSWSYGSGVVSNNGTLTTSNTASNTITIRNTEQSTVGNPCVIYNLSSGTATIKSGTTLTFTNERTNNVLRYVVNNKGTLNINGATLTGSPSSTYKVNYGINNTSSGKINMTSGTINVSGRGINNSSTAADSIIISDGSVISTQEYGIYNSSTETLTVTGGTITGKMAGIYSTSTGTIILGDNSNAINNDSPVITATATSGSYYGITNENGIIYFYDGKVVSNAGTGKSINGPVVDTPVGYVPIKTTENNVETAVLGTSNLYYNYLNVDTNKYYPTLYNALYRVQNNETIRVNNATVDESDNTSPVLAAEKTGVKLDLYGHTITLGEKYIKNQGELEIYSSIDSGTIDGENTNSTYGMIYNSGTLTTRNTVSNTLTIQNTAAASSTGARVLVNTSSGIVTLNAGNTITETTDCQNNTGRYLMNNAGILNINGATITNNPESTSIRNNGISNSGTINMTSGTINVSGNAIYSSANTTKRITIESGTIRSKNDNAIRTANGNITLGINDGTINANNPTIISEATNTNYYGIYITGTTGTLNFYDGKVISYAGKDHSININDVIDETPEGYAVIKTIENGIETASLNPGYSIKYTLDGGTASNPIGAQPDTVIKLADPVKTGYTFLGWSSSNVGANAKTGTTNNPTTSWDGSLTTNKYFKNLAATGTVTLVANWVQGSYLNVDTNTYYTSLRSALSAIQNNQTLRVTTAMADESTITAPSLGSTKTGVKIDLYGHTISMGTKTITNNGDLEIYSSVDGGLITGTNTTETEGIISNNGTLTTSNTSSNTLTIQNAVTNSASTMANARVIVNKAGKTLTLKTGTILEFSDRYAKVGSGPNRYVVQNESILNISGATITNNPVNENFSSNWDKDMGIYNGTAAKINMTQGLVRTSSTCIYNESTLSDSVTINNGALTPNSTQYAIINASTGTVNVTGGSVEPLDTRNNGIKNMDAGTININGGTIAGLYNNSSGTININSGSITTTGGGGIITNNGDGTINMAGGNISATGTNGSGIQNQSTGTINVTGGSITTSLSGINNQSTGTITLGDNSNAVNTESPIITTISSSNYGVRNSSGTFNFYDGKIVSHAGTGYAINGTVTNMPSGYGVVKTTTDGIETAILSIYYLNVQTNETYFTLADALSGVGNNQTIRLMAPILDESANTAPSLASTKTGVKLDLYGHTINLGTNTLTNNGSLEIYSSVDGGLLQGTNDVNNEGVVLNNGTLVTSSTASNTLTIKNNTAVSKQAARAVVNSEGNTVTLNTGTTLTMRTGNASPTGTTYVRYSITNLGVLNINGAEIINTPDTFSNYYRGVYNGTNGTVNMTSGTIQVGGIGIWNDGESSNSITIKGGTIIAQTHGIRNASTGTIILGDNSNAINNDNPSITSTYDTTIGSFYGINVGSGVLKFYDGKVISHSGANNSINGIASDTPVGYAVARTVVDGVETAQLFNGYSINYILGGGTASNPTNINHDAIVEIAPPTHEYYTFVGWVSDNVGPNAQTGTTSSNLTSWDGSLTTDTYFKNIADYGTVTMRAIWSSEYLNLNTFESYETLYEALDAVENNETIRVITNVTETENTAPVLADTKTGVKLDLYGHTITMGANYITNNGGLEIYSSVNGGMITGSNTTNTAGVILNNGTLTTSNTASNTLTLRNTAGAGYQNARVIVNSASKTLTLKTGTTITMTTNCTNSNNRYLIQNSGLININGANLTNNVTSTNTYNRGIYNVAATSEINMTSGTINVTGTGINVAAAATGNVTISGGTITSSNASAVYYGSTGTVTIGTDDATVNGNNPVITASSTSTSYYGLYVANGTLNFYDGKVVSNGGSGHSVNGTTSDTPDGYMLRKTLSGSTETADLVHGYVISYSLGGGTASNPTSAEFDSVVELAPPTRANYAFTGWTSTTLGANAQTGTTSSNLTSWDGSLTTNTYFKNLSSSASTVTLVANWINAYYLNVDTGKYYDNLYDAFDEVASNQTIRVTGASIDESSKTVAELADTKTGVKLDLYGHTITLGTHNIINNGGLEIYSSVNGGILTGSSTDNGVGVIKNRGTLTTSNTASNTLTIRNTAAAANYLARVIDNVQGATVTLKTGTTITMTTNCNNSNNRYLIGNSGTINLNGAAITNNTGATNTYNGGIYNTATGSINITSGTISVSGAGISNYSTLSNAITMTGGTITSYRGIGIYSAASATGIITLGVKDGNIDPDQLLISSRAPSGSPYCITLNGAQLRFYDGKVTSTRGSGYSISNGIIGDTEPGYLVTKTVADGVETAQLALSNDYYNYLNVNTNNSYSRLIDALGAVESNQTIRVVAESLTETSAASLLAGKTGVKLDLYGHSISMGTNTITNNGELEIYSSVDDGLLTSTVSVTNSTSGTITNNGTLTTSVTASNTLTIQNTAAAGTYLARVIVNNEGKSVTLNSGTTIKMTTACSSSNTRSLIQNSGALTINNATLTNYPSASNAYNRGINNLATGTINMTDGTIETSGIAINSASTAALSLKITGGTITAKRDHGVNSTGSGTTVQIGEDDGTINTSKPEIKSEAPSGTYYGFRTTAGTIKVYDGKFSSTRGSTTAFYGGVGYTPTGYVLARTVTSGTETAILEQNNGYYNYACLATGKYYYTLFDAIWYNNNKTITVNNASVNESANIAPNVYSTYTQKIDLNGHTISMGTKTLTNSGILEIYSSVDGGVITGSNDANTGGVIQNKGTLTFSETASNTLEIRSTTGASYPNARALVNASGATVTIKEGTTLKNTTDCSSSTTRYVIQNSGTVNLDGGTIWASPTSTTAYNKGIYNAVAAAKLNMTGGTINTSGIGIYNSGTGTDSVTISGGNITVTKSYAAYNTSTGTVTMSGGTANTTGGTGLYNAGSGTITVTGGTVTSNMHGIYNGANGTINLGTNDSPVNTNSPVITSTTTTTAYYGVRNDGTFNFYDGKIISNHGTGYSIAGNVDTTPTGYRVSKTTTEGVETAILTKIVENIYINKDGSPWNDSNMIIYLSTSSTENEYATGGGGGNIQVSNGNVAAFENLPAGRTYYIWASPSENDTISAEYTGISFVSGNTERTVNYYTFLAAFNDNNITSIIMDDTAYSNNPNQFVVLDNHTIELNAITASNYSIYKYDIIDNNLNTLDTKYENPTKYKVEGAVNGIVLYSRQQSGNYQNLSTGTGYTTLAEALQNVNSNQTIIVNNSRTETSTATLASSKTGVILDLNGKTINMDGNYISNSGGLDIYSSTGNGSITGTSIDTSHGIIYNTGTLTINNKNNQNTVTISNTSNSNNARLIVNSGNTTINSNVVISFTTASNSDRNMITNNGTLNINGAQLTGTTNDIGIENASAGAHVIMNSGSIITGETAIKNSRGTGSTDPAVKVVTGTISTNSPYGSIRNEASGTIRIEGGTISTTDGEYGTIYNYSGTIDITNGIINEGYNGYAILNESGTLNISGSVINGSINIGNSATLNMTGGTVNNNTIDGTVRIYGSATITGGTITSNKNGILINSGGSLTLGTEDTTLSQDVPLIKSTATEGTYYGINNSGTFNFYDGKIVSNRGTNYAINGTVTDIPDGYIVKKTTTDNVETAILNLTYNIYIKNDNIALNNSGVTIYLSTSSEENNYDTLGGGSVTVTTGNVATFENLSPRTTYYIWANPGDPSIFDTSEYTGLSFVPVANGSQTVNYYSFAIVANDTNITGATIDGEEMTLTQTWTETAFLNNHTINITPITETNYYVYKYDLVDGSLNLISTQYQTPSSYTINNAGVGMILYSREQSNNYENINTGTSYTTLYDAFQGVGNNETIRVNTNVTESSNTAPSLASTKTGVKLDLNGKTITMGTKTITNNGGLEIYSSVNGGQITGSYTQGPIITNAGTLTTNSTATNTITIQNTAGASYYNARVITNNNGKTMNLGTGTTVKCTTTVTSGSNRFVINNNGQLNLNGAIISNVPSATDTSYNKGINNTSTGKITINSGEINTASQGIYSSSTNASAIIMNGGSITAGGNAISNDAAGTVTINNGTLTSNVSYAIYNNKAGTVNVNDGKITVRRAYYGIYNSSTGTINFAGGTLTTKLIGIYGASSGPINVTGGTIIGETGGVHTISGTITLGSNDGTVNATPTIIAKSSIGVSNSSGSFNFYDGTIIAKEGTNHAISGAVTNVATGYEVTKTTTNGNEVAVLAPYSRMRSASEIISGQSNGGTNTYFLNTNIYRGEIGSITFAKEVPSGITLINGTDISEHTDGSVMMYMVNNGKTVIKDYYIIQSGGVHFPVNSAYLFYQLPNLEFFNVQSYDSLANIKYVVDTSYMMAGDSSLEEYMIAGVNMSLDSVINMKGMFMNDVNLDTVSLGISELYLNAPNLENISNIFALDSKLNTVGLYLNTSKNSLTDLSGMFNSNIKLTEIYGIENLKYTENANIQMFYNTGSLSLNTMYNAVDMLYNNPQYTGTDTLRYVGFTRDQIDQITNLSNWPALEADGWTTGYDGH